MPAKLYAVPGSHPSRSAELMLEHKGIEYERMDLISAVHKPVLRGFGFAGTTVPALRIDGRRIQGSRRISRALEEIQPEPPLFPSDPERRAAVEEAERWGDEELQPVPRRLGWWAIKRDRSSIESFLQEEPILGIPPRIARMTSGPIVWAAIRLNDATDEAVARDLDELPGLLDTIDRRIDEGVLGGDEPNAADFQIAPSVRLLMCFDDLRPSLEGRPAGELAMRICPEFPGHIGPVLGAVPGRRS